MGIRYVELMGCWILQPVRHSYDCGLWKVIRPIWDSFSRFVGFGLGDVGRIRFWEDKWCSGWSLVPLYLVLFQLAVNKETMVSDCMKMRNGGIQWNLTLVRFAHDW